MITVGELKTFLKTWEDDEAQLCFGVENEYGGFEYQNVDVIGVELGDLTLAGEGYTENPKFKTLYPKP